MNALEVRAQVQESIPKEITPPVADIQKGHETEDPPSQALPEIEWDEKALLSQLRKVMGEVMELKREARWEEIVALCHPLGEKYPLLVETGLDADLRRELAFAMTHLNMHAQALEEVRAAMAEDDHNDYRLNYACGYIAYDALYRHKNRESQLSYREKARYMEIAHTYFRQCQVMAPERVTPFYREAMLYKDIEAKPKKAIPLFKKAIENWRGYPEGVREERHYERPKYAKALYHLASCYVKLERPDVALGLLGDLIKEDRGKDHVHPHFKHFAMAKALYRLDRYKEALSHLNVASKERLDRSSRHAPDYVIELMAACLLGLGRPDEAIRVISKIPEKKRRPFVRWREAEALLAKGEAEDALLALSSCLERDRRSRHKTLLKMAKIYFKLKEYHKVIEYAKKGGHFFKTTYQNPLNEAKYLEALSRYMLGEKERARELITQLKRDGFKFPGFKKNYRIIMGQIGGNA